MKLGLQLGYWQAQPPTDTLEKVLEAEKLGYDIVFTAESWGSDAFSPLAWVGSSTSTIRLATAVVQISARQPTSVAMHALTLDHLSGGRHTLGLGLSGPQVVEGWYGRPFGKPLGRTREYVDIIRQVLARQGPVTSDGPHYPLPYTGEGALGMGKPLKPIVHPLREDLPIWIGSEGPKNVALTAEIADGWLPIYYSPKVAGMYNEWLDEGFARPGARRDRASFEIAANCGVVVTDDRDAVLDQMKSGLAFYIGGMGAKEMNFHKNVFARMGYEKEADEIQDLFYEGERDKAIAAVPREAVADINLVGTKEQIRDDLAAWEEAGITHLVIGGRDLDQIRLVADVILGA
ncbi:LLM class F420-dependent oxidoreductase [Acidimicrobiia bacterium EGI L10123]|uniref:LLM class F420-dependent oxidoreductase n=1 Tax=Salinilacustrithrix flava TaxID=2957203 RepID=UPI003D7C3463|nr:LLM class F420-dependent oxidoreductase [Acidimicrobiia bacterium EGI L10123]